MQLGIDSFRALVRGVIPTIKYLYVNSATTKGYSEFIAMLTQTNKIKTIYFTVRVNALSIYNTLFQKTPNLKSITFYRLDDENVDTLIKYCPLLRKVDGECSHVALERMITQLPNLKEIYIADMKGTITVDASRIEKLVVHRNAGIVHRSLPKLPNLRVLTFRCKSKKIQQVIKYCPKLEELTIDEDVTEAQVLELVTKCPKLRFIHRPGIGSTLMEIRKNARIIDAMQMRNDLDVVQERKKQRIQ